jgi:hypothetical protein
MASSIVRTRTRSLFTTASLQSGTRSFASLLSQADVQLHGLSLSSPSLQGMLTKVRYSVESNGTCHIHMFHIQYCLSQTLTCSFSLQYDSMFFFGTGRRGTVCISILSLVFERRVRLSKKFSSIRLHHAAAIRILEKPLTPGDVPCTQHVGETD